MKKFFDSQLETYIKGVSDAVSCPYGRKKEFLRELRQVVSDFTETNPEASVEEIERQFGSPEEIAESFNIEADMSKAKIRTDIRKIILYAVIIALVIWVAFVIISLIDVHTEAHGYFSEGLLSISRIIIGGKAL